MSLISEYSEYASRILDNNADGIEFNRMTFPLDFQKDKQAFYIYFTFVMDHLISEDKYLVNIGNVIKRCITSDLIGWRTYILPKKQEKYIRYMDKTGVRV